MMNYSTEHPCSGYRKASFWYVLKEVARFSEKTTAKSMPHLLFSPVHIQPIGCPQAPNLLGAKKIYTLELSVFQTKIDFPTKLSKVAQETEKTRHIF